MTKELLSYKIDELLPYINWIYYFYAWGFPPRYASAAYVHACPGCWTTWRGAFGAEDRSRADEAIHVYQEAQQVLFLFAEADIRAASVYRLCQAFADGDDLLLDGIRLPLLRQQTPHADGSPYLCLSDFVRPLHKSIPDTVGVFATSIPRYDEAKRLAGDDPFRSLTAQLLLERLAEAATERMHERVRRVTWGYAPDERLQRGELLTEKFQGIRPAVGYPSLPDLSVNFILDQLLTMSEVGIKLTESAMMQPDASVSGLMLAHPQARYFSVGRVGQDQLDDYARRRGIPLAQLQRFLSNNK